MAGHHAIETPEPGHPIETSELVHQVCPDPNTEALLYKALWQGLIQSGLWYIDSLSLTSTEGLEIRGWAIRPECWFGETTFTVNGRPFTAVERDGDRPDVVSALRVAEDRVSGFRCRIDLKDLPEGVKDFHFTYADRRTLTPLAASDWWHFSGVDTPLPEPARRGRVNGWDDAGFFILSGAMHYGLLVDALNRTLGKTFDDFPCVLDWGCGSGRVLRYVAARHDVNLTGIDIDADNVGWCKATFPKCSFHAIDLDPPVPLAAESIDLVYAYSVFTHLSERDQFKWLEELRRVTRPGGVLLLSLHGEHAWFRALSHATPSQYAEWKRHGFFDAGHDPNLSDYIRDANYYRSVWHDVRYVAREWSRFFKIVEYFPGMFQLHQDLVVLVRE
jgi:SAM-dependent methyltransferase